LLFRLPFPPPLLLAPLAPLLASAALGTYSSSSLNSPPLALRLAAITEDTSRKSFEKHTKKKQI
jgi:hypothetical protein